MSRTPRSRAGRWAACAAAALLAARPADAGKVVLRIRAGNPSSQPQKVSIRSNLPPGVTPKDVLNAAGLDIGYDVKNDIYFVHKEVPFAAKDSAVYDVEIDDIWVIPAGQIAALRARAGQLTDRLRSYREYHEAAEQLKQDIGRNLDQVAELQDKASIRAGARPVQHIAAFEANQKVLTKVKRDVGRLENLVLGTGQDPGEIVGEAREFHRPRGDVEFPPGDYKTAIYRVTVRNTSPTTARKVPVRRELPAEIRTMDVVDPGGLDLTTDPRTGACVVFKNEVELLANQTVTFDVKIRDKWNVNEPRMRVAMTNAADVLTRVATREQFKSVEAALHGAISELKALMAEPAPTELNDAYVAFFRQQAAKLDAIEQKIYRIESALKPIERTTQKGFKPKPPSSKTTWLIIWAILGFLFVFSLLFFFRWFGRDKAEKTLAGGPGTEAPAAGVKRP